MRHMSYSEYRWRRHVFAFKDQFSSLVITPSPVYLSVLGWEGSHGNLHLYYVSSGCAASMTTGPFCQQFVYVFGGLYSSIYIRAGFIFRIEDMLYSGWWHRVHIKLPCVHLSVYIFNWIASFWMHWLMPVVHHTGLNYLVGSMRNSRGFLPNNITCSWHLIFNVSLHLNINNVIWYLFLKG